MGGLHLNFYTGLSSTRGDKLLMFLLRSMVAGVAVAKSPQFLRVLIYIKESKISLPETEGKLMGKILFKSHEILVTLSLYTAT